jgi:hypothetical protein
MNYREQKNRLRLTGGEKHKTGMTKTIYDLPEALQRVAMITHMHEMCVKSGRCDQMLRETYNRMLVYAEANGIRVSTILPEDTAATNEVL